MQYEVSVSIWAGWKIIENNKNGCHLKTTSENPLIFDVHICAPNMKFVCLNLWLGEVCTDGHADADANADTNDDHARQSMIGKGSLVDKPNEPKTLLSILSIKVVFF